MAKDVKTVTNDEALVEEMRTGERERRRTTYTRVQETSIPEEVVEVFKKDNWSLRWVRYLLNGEEDFSSLQKRERSGYEFVRAEELPDWYRKTLKIVDGRNRKGMVTVGDLCLMKADTALIEDRIRYYQNETSLQAQAADLNTLIKTKGFIDQGMRSRVTAREPGFQD